MKNRIAITITDYNRLVGLMEYASINVKMPKSVETLYDQLTAAEMFPQDAIANEVITMNSKVLLREMSSGREAEVTITYPQDANPQERRVSVFSEIGMALIGRKEGDVVSWTVPRGRGQFEILKVTYQPEAAGDFDL